MDTDGIGIHHKITAGITTSQRKQSEFLLDKAKDQPQYQLYWKDSMGNFQPLVEDTDISIANRAVVEPRDNGGTYL